MMFHPHIFQLDVGMTASQMPEDMETQVAVLERNIARGGMNNVQSWTPCDKYGCRTASHSPVGHGSEIRTEREKRAQYFMVAGKVTAKLDPFTDLVLHSSQCNSGRNVAQLI